MNTPAKVQVHKIRSIEVYGKQRENLFTKSESSLFCFTKSSVWLIENTLVVAGDCEDVHKTGNFTKSVVH